MNIEEMRDLADCCPQRCHEALLWGADEIERLEARLDGWFKCEARLRQAISDVGGDAMYARALELAIKRGPDDPPTSPYCPHGFNAYCDICGDLLRAAVGKDGGR